MKRAKESILLIIFCSNIVLLAVFIGILYYAFPANFRKKAQEALRFEAVYVHDLHEYGYWIGTDDEYEKNFLSNNINYLYPKRENDDAQLATEDVLEFYHSGEYKTNTLCDWKTENGTYVIYGTQIPSDSDAIPIANAQKIEPLVMYINIEPFISMTDRMIWILLGFFICETLFMEAIGWRLGNRIENAQEAQRKFFQNTSHELKTPLMSIQGYAEGIEAGVVEAASGSKIIMQETDRMTKLVEELLSISKIDANQMTLNRTVMDARELLYDCMYDLAPLAEMNQIVMVPEFTEQSVRINCDEKMLERAFRNILSNAIRHGKEKINIKCSTQEHQLTIQFIDDGSGIEEKDLPHVFERFYTGNGGSTGIGLALADEIIRLHGGKILVFNRTDASGAIFEIRMPVFS